MADDFAARRPTEIDYLNGEVVRLAHSLGRPAPVNEEIVSLVRQAEAGVERTWSAAELRAHVLKRHRGAAGFGY
jgi:2-dehydropantoate 2-reductase